MFQNKMYNEASMHHVNQILTNLGFDFMMEKFKGTIYKKNYFMMFKINIVYRQLDRL